MTSRIDAGRAAGEIEFEEHLPVDEGGQHVGRIARSAAGQDIDHVEDAEGVGEADDEDDGDHGPEQRQDDQPQDLQARGAVDPRRLDRIGRQAGEAGEEHEDVEGQRQPEIGDHDGRPREPDIGEPQRAVGRRTSWRSNRSCRSRRDEHPSPGERADHRRDHQRQARRWRLEDAGAGEPAMQRQRDREAEDRFEQQRRRDEAERLGERVRKSAVGDDAQVVGKPDEGRLAAEDVVLALRLSQTRPARSDRSWSPRGRRAPGR